MKLNVDSDLPWLVSEESFPVFSQNGGQPSSLPESRAMTISIDFDRTFAADPPLWGEFARKAVADGNTVVMVSRRPETTDDRQAVTNTLGDYADAFSQVLLVGGDTLKDDAAKAAGLNVDVWVDDAPQTIKPPMDCGCDEQQGESQRDCGANASGGGGFQPGNTCGKGGGGGGSSGGGSSGSGGGSSGGGRAPGGLRAPSKKHTVKLPKSKAKITLDQGNEALKQLGYKVGKAKTKKVGKGFVTMFEVSDSTGHKANLTADEIKDLAYENRK